MEPKLFDAERRALECSSELEREAWLRYTSSARPGEDEGSYYVDASVKACSILLGVHLHTRFCLPERQRR